MQTISRTIEKPADVDTPKLSHLWLKNRPFALCGAGPRKYKGSHPEAHLYERCADCCWKAKQMGFTHSANGRAI